MAAIVVLSDIYTELSELYVDYRPVWPFMVALRRRTVLCAITGNALVPGPVQISKGSASVFGLHVRVVLVASLPHIC